MSGENTVGRGIGAPSGEVAPRLRAAREAKGISLREFAKRLTESGHRVSHAAVLKYETGELTITPEYLAAVSSTFAVPYGWFLSGINPEEVNSDFPALSAPGLEFLPKSMHTAVAVRLDTLANWCGVPGGSMRHDFYGLVGNILRAPFSESERWVRPWSEFTERELTVYIEGQFALLRTVLQRWGENDG